MRVLLLLSLLASITLPTLAQTTLPFLLQNLGPVNSSYGNSLNLVVRNEAFTVTGAVNAIAPGTAAVNVLATLNHFIVLVLNSESFDSIMGAFPAGNSLANPSFSPPYNKQTQRPRFNGTIAAPTLSNASVLNTIPADEQLKIGGGGGVPNAPLLYNQYIGTTDKVSFAPPHGYQQVMYKVDSGKMDGFAWTAVPNANADAMGHWNLTGSTLWTLASSYTLFDNFFSSAFGGSLLPHLYLVGGRSVVWNNGASTPPRVLSDGLTLAFHNYSTVDGILEDISQAAPLTYPDYFLINDINSPSFCGGPSFPAINDASNGNGAANLVDQLISAGVSWGYYAQDWLNITSQSGNSTCTTAGNDAQQAPSMLPLTHYARFNRPSPSTSPDSGGLQDLDAAFFSKLAAKQLESVVWVQPDARYDWGGGNASPASSDAWLNLTMGRIFASPHWAANDTMVLITFAGANGFYDHVPPYAGDRFGPGLRVATIAVSPYHRAGGVNHNAYEHLSIVKMLQTRFGLPQTSNGDGSNALMGKARDQATRDLANSFNEAAAGNVIHTNAAVKGARAWLTVVGLIALLIAQLLM